MKSLARKSLSLVLVFCAVQTLLRPGVLFAGVEYVAYDLGYGRAYDINSARTVTGVSDSDGLPRAFSFSDGVMTDLGVLPGMDSSIGYAVNELDNVVGVSFSSDGSGGFPQGFRFKIDTMAGVGTLGLASSAYDINNSGIVVGESVVNEAGFPTRAFAAVGGQLTDLGTLGGSSSAALGINSAGTIVGWADTASGSPHAFGYSAGVMTDLGALEVGGSSYASDINDQGVAVGWASLGRNERAFVYSAGRMIALGTLGGANSVANAINLEGVIVGSATSRNGKTHAFVCQEGRMTDLAPYLAPMGITGDSEALGVNDLGDIVGSGEDSAGQRHAFLLLCLSDHRLLSCRHRPQSAGCRLCNGSSEGSDRRRKQSASDGRHGSRD